jgi:hypothetical protein
MEIANSKQKQKTTKTDFCNGSTGSLKSSKKALVAMMQLPLISSTTQGCQTCG